MKPSSVALFLAVISTVSDFVLQIIQIPSKENSEIVVAMFLCTSFICRAVEELKK